MCAALPSALSAPTVPSASTKAPAAATTYACALEPPGLLGHFLAHPPEGFAPRQFAGGVPGFVADFDLLTTADEQLLATLAQWPGQCALRRLLTWRTCFAGSTVSEYLPLPAHTTQHTSPAALLEAVLQDWQRSTRLLILKDLALPTELLSDDETRYAGALLQACAARGFVLVEGQALAYVPIDFASEDEYLARLSSGRRKDIRRKLRARQGLHVQVLATGDERFADEALRARLYALYQQVYAQSELHFDRLSAEFFRAVLQDAALDGRVFLYTTPAGELVGFNLCFVHRGMLIDKYIGLDYALSRHHNLYFVSWMENLAYARTHGLRHYIAGWTDPQIKAYLGARFALTQHAVYVRNPLLRAVLARLARWFERDHAWFADEGHELHKRR